MVESAVATSPRYGDRIERAIHEIEVLLGGSYGVSARAMALLVLQGDAEVTDLVRQQEGERFARIQEIVTDTEQAADRSIGYLAAMARQAAADQMVARCVEVAAPDERRWGEMLGRLTMRPVTGIPILIAVIYLGLYQFVGQFGAGTLVGFFEDIVFGEYVNPLATDLVTAAIPWPFLQSLFVGEYGIFTLGFRYAVAIILPIVGSFFIVFSILEDSGYLPRLAMLIDRVFKLIGLNGRAVIPLVLGLGCDTMATVVTRVLETRRERVLATFFLALAVPCSAQLGVTLGILSESGTALLLWIAFVCLIFIAVGVLAARLVPGERPSFYMELPPLRMPQPINVLTKTYTRMEWYFFEVLPLFLLASVLIWLGQLTGIFQWTVGLLEPIVALLGLPRESGAAFLFGFFRRDYGAAGLYDMAQAGLLTTQQMLVAAVTLTLFVPCVAQFSIMLKERGAKLTLGMVAFIFPFAGLMGYFVNRLLTALAVPL